MIQVISKTELKFLQQKLLVLFNSFFVSDVYSIYFLLLLLLLPFSNLDAALSCHDFS